MRFLATFDTHDFFYSRLFLFLTEKNIATFDSSRNFGQNRHEIKKKWGMDRDIRNIKYPRLLNFYKFATYSTRDF